MNNSVNIFSIEFAIATLKLQTRSNILAIAKKFNVIENILNDDENISQSFEKKHFVFTSNVSNQYKKKH